MEQCVVLQVLRNDSIVGKSSKRILKIDEKLTVFGMVFTTEVIIK